MTSDVRSAQHVDELDRVDWKEARARMKRVIASNLKGSVDSDELEDLAQEAVVGLLRAVRRGGIQNLEAIEVTIAKRLAIDRMRRKRWTEPLEDDPGTAAPERDDEPLDPEEAQFYVGAMLESLGEKCRELFDRWLETFNLAAVAERLRISHAAARKRSERCRERALEICRADQGPLGDWARGQLGLA